MSERLRTLKEEQAHADAARTHQGGEDHRDRAPEGEDPHDWHWIEHDVPVRPRKTRLTACFDTDLVKWFQAMGHGYQARLYVVLRTFILAVQSKEILSQRDLDWKGDEIWGRAAPKRKPED